MEISKGLEKAGTKGLSLNFHDFFFLLNGLGIFELHKQILRYIYIGLSMKS